MELGLRNILFGIWMEVLLAQSPLGSESVNDPRCTPISYIVRFSEGPEHLPFAYAVLHPDQALLPDDVILKKPVIYDETLQRCISEVDDFCVSDTDCGIGAICNNTSPYPTQFYDNPDDPRRLDPSKYPLIGMCRCLDGKVTNSIRTGCLPMAKFGDSCDLEKKPCGPSVDCVNNKCVCDPRRVITRVDTESNGNNRTYYYAVLPDKPYQGNPSDILEFPRSYDEEGKRCIMKDEPHLCLFRSDCSLTKTCVTSWSENFGSWEGGDYQDHSKTRHPLLGSCGCHGGMTSRVYLDPKTDKCVSYSTYGEPCNADFPCSPDGLKCENGRCPCADEGKKYDSILDSCVTQIGFECGYSSGCVSNAICKGNPPVCECEKDFVNSNGNCYAKHLAPCGRDAKCDPAGFLKCIDGYCKCGDLLNQVYESEGLKCQALAGSKCSINNNGGNRSGAPGCTKNAICLDGVCKCRPGMVVNSERQCGSFRGQGAYCGPKGCNYQDGWACIENTCKCVDDNLKVNNGKCVSQIGSYCGYVDVVGKKSDRDPDPAKQLYYYVGCDEGICDARVGERSICKNPCSG